MSHLPSRSRLHVHTTWSGSRQRVQPRGLAMLRDNTVASRGRYGQAPLSSFDLKRKTGY